MRVMTTTDAGRTTAGTTAAETVERFLAAALAGRGDDLRALYAADAVLDATVPGWRFARTGPDNIARQYAGWFSEPGTFDELVRMPTPTGEAVRYLVRSQEDGVPYVAHHMHVFEIGDDGRIRRDTFFCGGRWDAALQARMAQENA